MSEENQQRAKVTVGLAGLVSLVVALYSVFAWASDVPSKATVNANKGRIQVLESQYNSILNNQQYMRRRLDEMSDR